MPGLRWKEEYEVAILFQHLSLWDALPYTHEVRSLLNPDLSRETEIFTLRNESQNPTSWPFKPFKSQFPVNMENLPGNNGNGQAYGYTLYETTIIRGGSLKSGRNIQDRALVSADKQSRCAVVYEYASALFHFNQDSPPPPPGFCEPKFHWHFSPPKCRISCFWWKGMILCFTSLYLYFCSVNVELVY